MEIEIDRGRNLETVGDHGEFGLVDVDLDDLALEPQRAVELVVRAELEAVQAAHLLHDLARRFDALDVDLVERVAEEHLRRVKPAVLAERERVDAGQAEASFLIGPSPLRE